MEVTFSQFKDKLKTISLKYGSYVFQEIFQNNKINSPLDFELEKIHLTPLGRVGVIKLELKGQVDLVSSNHMDKIQVKFLVCASTVTAQFNGIKTLNLLN